MRRRHFIHALGGGSDFPCVPPGAQQQQLAQLGLDSAQPAGIRSANAIRLIPRLKG
jgi:hypothetical protein